jgi:hypothetical protein
MGAFLLWDVLCFGRYKNRVDSAVKGNSPQTMISDVINAGVKMS